MCTTAIIADDHEQIRQGLASLLPTYRVEVLATTGNGAGVVPLIDEHRPDLLILDINMPGRNGLDVLYDLRSEGYDTHVIILSAHDDEAYIAEAFSRGADEYVVKGHMIEGLEAAIRSVHDVEEEGAS